MAQAKKGDTAKVHYTGTLSDGTVFDSSQGGEPLEFTLGAGQLIPGFDAAVDGMAVGEKKSVTIPAEEAYGPRHDEMVFEVNRSQLPPDMEPQVGMQLQAQGAEGAPVVLAIAEVNGDAITLDGNHPLAGKDLTFEIELVSFG